MQDHTQTNRLELLAPARNLAYGIEAINHGADAVYMGGPAFGARSAAGNSLDDIEALARHGVTPAELAAATLDDAAANERRRALIREVAERAEGYYADARKLMPYLSRDGRAIYGAMTDIYHALLVKIRRRDYDVFGERVRLPGWYKALLALRRMGSKLLPFRFGS